MHKKHASMYATGCLPLLAAGWGWHDDVSIFKPALLVQAECSSRSMMSLDCLTGPTTECT